jgi:predicted nucleotidyltransferase
MTIRLIPYNDLAMRRFCCNWKIARLEWVGSFPPPEEITVVATFEPSVRWSLLDHARMERELGDIVARKVDLVSRSVVEAMPNALSRNFILGNINPFRLYG